MMSRGDFLLLSAGTLRSVDAVSGHGGCDRYRRTPRPAGVDDRLGPSGPRGAFENPSRLAGCASAANRRRRCRGLGKAGSRWPVRPFVGACMAVIAVRRGTSVWCVLVVCSTAPPWEGAVTEGSRRFPGWCLRATVGPAGCGTRPQAASSCGVSFTTGAVRRRPVLHEGSSSMRFVLGRAPAAGEVIGVIRDEDASPTHRDDAAVIFVWMPVTAQLRRALADRAGVLAGSPGRGAPVLEAAAPSAPRSSGLNRAQPPLPPERGAVNASVTSPTGRRAAACGTSGRSGTAHP